MKSLPGAREKMYFDITTPEKQREADREYRKYLLIELDMTLGMEALLRGNERLRAQAAVKTVNDVRARLYQKAGELGYVDACVRSIPDCKGDCCKWHFPKNLTCIDLFITICGISPEERSALGDRLDSGRGRYECPFLNPDGCLFSFETRPMVCSNAYPCFAGDTYHHFLEHQRKVLEVPYRLLNDLCQQLKHNGIDPHKLDATQSARRKDGIPLPSR
jgi:hypothetical protein